MSCKEEGLKSVTSVARHFLYLKNLKLKCNLGGDVLKVHAFLINIVGRMKKISDGARVKTKTNLGKLKLLTEWDYPFLFISTFLFTVKNAHSAVIFGRNVIVRFRQMNSKVAGKTTYRRRDKA